jgi:phosphoesterase RecJ-like protein
MVLGHQHPDGDALGSAAALAGVLRGLGKSAFVGVSGRVAPGITFLMEPKEFFLEAHSPAPDFFAGFGLLAFVDCHGPDRVWPGADPELFRGLPPHVVIDHHRQSGDLRGAAACFLDPSASSAGELVCRLMRAMKIDPGAQTAEAALTAIVSDTNFFTLENTTPSSLREAAGLLERGGNPARLFTLINCGHSLARMRLLERSLATLSVFLEGRAAVMLLTPDMLECSGARVEDSDGFIEFPRSLAGVSLAAFIKDAGSGPVKVSLRSRAPVSALDIAKAFGGGGHILASAYNEFSAGVLEARARLLAEASRSFLGMGLISPPAPMGAPLAPGGPLGGPLAREAKAPEK